MKGYENLSSAKPPKGLDEFSDADLLRVENVQYKMQSHLSKEIDTAELLLCRVMVIDACIDLIKTKSPFAQVDVLMADMSRLCAELTKDCMRLYEFCMADYVLDKLHSDSPVQMDESED